MAILRDTHFLNTDAMHLASAVACAEKPSQAGTRGNTEALAARCVR
jgi:hypothetical protein